MMCEFCETYEELKNFEDKLAKGKFKYAISLVSYSEDENGEITSKTSYGMGLRIKPNYCPYCGRKF